jgi:mono/diheme cytochrome c family protein
MGRSRHAVVGVLFGALGCNAAPPVPDNPVPALAPDLGTTTTLADSPPPISGGTLLLSRDGTTAIAADPDRDFVSFVDLASGAVRARTDLSAHDEPGRLVEDMGGLVHVALRGSGELATFSLATGALLGRRAVCAQPRGVAYDSEFDQVVVACATGELVTLPAASGPALQVQTIEPGLRDVVIDGDSIFLSKFRTAEVLRLTRNGDIVQRTSLPADGGNSPAMAWRMRASPDHQLYVAYQIDSTSFVPTTPGGYGNAGSGGSTAFPGSPGSGPGVGVVFASGGGGSAGLSGFNPNGGIVRTAVASLSMPDLTPTPLAGPSAANVLPVDLALPPAGGPIGSVPVLVAAGNWKSALTSAYATLAPGPVGPFSGATPAAIDGQVIATEIRQDGTILLQSREPAVLYFVRPGITGQPDVVVSSTTLSDVSREDTGHTIFHTNSGGSVACASCHGEGGDDSQTWNFGGTKPRRTPSLLGTVKGTAPYHWDADFPDLRSLSHEVYTRRMSGRVLASDQVSALQGWLEQLPAPKRPNVDPAARARGQVLFQGKAACASCHSGPSYTNNATVDVGTGAALQVPPLVGVGDRAPFMHAGCAKTLTERFTACATDAHGQTSNLTSAEIGDLVTFMESL